MKFRTIFSRLNQIPYPFHIPVCETQISVSLCLFCSPIWSEVFSMFRCFILVSLSSCHMELTVTALFSQSYMRNLFVSCKSIELCNILVSIIVNNQICKTTCRLHKVYYDVSLRPDKGMMRIRLNQRFYLSFSSYPIYANVAGGETATVYGSGSSSAAHYFASGSSNNGVAYAQVRKET